MASTPRPVRTDLLDTGLFNPELTKTARSASGQAQLRPSALPVSSVPVPHDPHSQAQRRRALGGLLVQQTVDPAKHHKLTFGIGEDVLAASSVMRSANFSSTSPRDLERMAELYDAQFFDSQLLNLGRQFNLTFRWSSRMTSAGGKTIRTAKRDRRTGKTSIKYEIALSSALLFQTFGDLQRPIRVTGFHCTNRLQAMQRILEHELIHLAEMLVWDDSCCAAPRFQGIAQRLFCHTEHKHDLVTQHERAAKKYNVRVGSTVAFTFEGKRLMGKVNRITKRATILVKDPAGQSYSDGFSYRKYYVPLAHLKAI